MDIKDFEKKIELIREELEETNIKLEKAKSHLNNSSVNSKINFNLEENRDKWIVLLKLQNIVLNGYSKKFDDNISDKELKLMIKNATSNATNGLIKNIKAYELTIEKLKEKLDNSNTHVNIITQDRTSIQDSNSVLYKKQVIKFEIKVFTYSSRNKKVIGYDETIYYCNSAGKDKWYAQKNYSNKSSLESIDNDPKYSVIIKDYLKSKV